MNKEFWQEKIKIGNLEFPRVMAAPLDGVTDSPLRQLIREFSPEVLLFSEMRHVACVANERDQKSVLYKRMEKPICFQVAANNLNFIDLAIEKILAQDFDMLNLNAGCPSRVVIKSGSGSALMGDLPRFEMILKRMYLLVKGKIPLTLKMRAGFKIKNAIEAAKMAEGCGVSMIIIHPRTQPEMSNPPPDYELAKKVKEAISVPLVFSGELKTFEDCKATYEKTGCDGFMIGRALWGFPWKIKEIMEASQGRAFTMDKLDAVHYAVKHYKLVLEHYGPRGFASFKKQLPNYIWGLNGAVEIRKRLLLVETADEMLASLEALVHENELLR